MKKIIGYKKEKKSWITPIITLLITVIISITIYELQILFEKNKKQSEYLEKIYKNVEQIYIKKVALNNKALMIKINGYKQYQQTIFKIVNDNNSSKNLFELYTKEFENLRNIGDSTINNNDNFDTVLESSKIVFIEDKLKINISFLELYSNQSLKKYQNEIFKSFSMIDTLYKTISNDIDASILKMHDYIYIYRNIDTNKKLLTFFYSLPYPKNTKESLQKLQIENRKIAKELSDLTRKILEDINIKLNGNKFEILSIIQQNKAKSFLEK